jgi:hypothetical protein
MSFGTELAKNSPWWFQEDRSGTVVRKDPLENLFNARSELDAVDILVRESLQNSVDARSENSTQVSVRFRLVSVSGKRRNEILEAADFESLARHINASNRTLKGQSSRFADPNSVRSHDDLVLLYIEDFGTRGLVGPEFKKRDGDATSLDPQCFVGLCRAIGMNEKDESRAHGGTYGFGKGVYWAASSIGTVLFHSVLDNAYSVTAREGLAGDGNNDIRARSFGVARLVSHELDEHEYSTVGFHSSKLTPRGPQSWWNDEAFRVAKGLGMTDRKQLGAGTSILVLAARDPSAERPRQEILHDPHALAEHIERSSAHYFWPALRRGILNVEIQVGTDPPRAVDLDSHPELTDFLEAFDVAATISKRAGFEYQSRSISVPAWEAEGVSAADSQYAIAIKLAKGEANPSPAAYGPAPNRTALIRGGSMVVGYIDPPRRNCGKFGNSSGRTRTWFRSVRRSA